VVTDGRDVGSLVGRIGGGGVVNCHVVNADVTGNTGDVAAWWEAPMESSRNARREDASPGIMYVGGLVGEVGEGTVKRSYSRASVSGNENVGGLVGRHA